MVDKVTDNEALIADQIANSGEKDARSTGILKAEQPIREEIPDTAVVVREYAKWTDNDGDFHKVPIDGTTAIREPAHEQHELTVEDRDRLDQTLALKTPRRDNAKAAEILGRRDEIHNNDYNLPLAEKAVVEPDAKQKGPVADNKEGLVDAKTEVKVGTPAS